ncbi:hypothetical protein [Burkholderia gladioli]|uniref:hypothetical protein n=1 Tax=Burkholderia gladioli TaxID=28095 RepID=UPI00163F74D8|nr:hypothetical protein [Burkholderia gladioli]
MNKAYQAGERAAMNNVASFANPHPYWSHEARQWLKGWEDGREMRSKIYAHELRLYKKDPDRMEMLWGY